MLTAADPMQRQRVAAVAEVDMQVVVDMMAAAGTGSR
jgi:hypothetical protein